MLFKLLLCFFRGNAIISESMGEALYPPGVNVAHSSCESFRQVVARKMDIQERRRRIAMAGELDNLMKLPSGTGQALQPHMPQVLRRESTHRRLPFHFP